MSTTEVLPAATAKLPAIVFSLQPGLKVECPPSGLEGKKKKKRRRRRKEKEKKSAHSSHVSCSVVFAVLMVSFVTGKLSYYTLAGCQIYLHLNIKLASTCKYGRPSVHKVNY